MESTAAGAVEKSNIKSSPVPPITHQTPTSNTNTEKEVKREGWMEVIYSKFLIVLFLLFCIIVFHVYTIEYKGKGRKGRYTIKEKYLYLALPLSLFYFMCCCIRENISILLSLYLYFILCVVDV